MVNLGFLHPSLLVFVAKEFEHSVEGLLRIVRHISERPALAVLKKIVPGKDHFTHCGLDFDGLFVSWRARNCTCNICTYKYCIPVAGNGKG